MLSWIFKKRISDYYEGRLGEMGSYPISYIYGDVNLSNREMTQIILLENERHDRQEVMSTVSSRLSRYPGDNIIINGSGSLILTPCFKDLAHRNRRWQRLQLQNSLILGIDFAKFEDDYGEKLLSHLNSSLDDFIKGTWIKEPLSAKYLRMLDELTRMGDRVTGRRKDSYDILTNGNEDIKERLRMFTEGICLTERPR